MKVINNGKRINIYEIVEFENKKKTQNSEVKVPSDVSTLQQAVLKHPANVNGILWENLKIEILRLATYSNYLTRATKSALLLARDGFVYIGDGSGDTVMCYSCCVTKDNWLASEDVSEVHRKLSNGCSMVTGIESDNVPIIVGSERFEDILQTLSVLNDDEGYCSFEIDREVKTSNIETDAAPLTCQEQTHSHYSTSNGLKVNPGKGQRIQPIGKSSKNQISFNSSSSQMTNGIAGKSNSSQFASLETASITMPPSEIRPQQTSTVPQVNFPHSTNTTQTNYAVSHDTYNLPENRQSRSSSNRNVPTSSGKIQAIATPNNITINSESLTNQVSTNQPKHSEPPKSSAGKSKDGKVPTYAELGIITERPKRTEYAVKLERIKTFSSWPRTHHIKLEDLADAGFYYAGYGDCARCFFCGGGLRNWEDEDDVWVEHARWFPKCAFIRQLMGQNFVDAVQDLNKTADKISFTMVTDKMGTLASAYLLGSKTNPLKRDPAVEAMLEFGYDETSVLQIASLLKSQDTQLSADVLLCKLKADGKVSKRTPQHVLSKSIVESTSAKDLELIRQIKETNSTMRQQTMCKICMDKDVEVVFLPCGHLVSCAECAGALKDCPVCRKPVKGTVRAFLG